MKIRNEIVELQVKVVNVEYVKIRPVEEASISLGQACKIKGLQEC